MTQAFDPRQTRRFVRTLRVATQTALAGADLARARGEARPGATFLALAAKSGDWQFPADGLMSADGLVLARIVEEAGVASLELQAQGAAGLSVYAGRKVRLRVGFGAALDSAFDRDGRLTRALDSAGIVPADLASFQIEFLGDTP